MKRLAIIITLSGTFLGCAPAPPDTGNIRAENARLLAELDRLRSDEKKKSKAEIQQLRETNTQLQDTGANQEEIDRLKRELEAEREAFEEYKAKYRLSIRARSKGMRLGDVEYLGSTLKEARISRIDDIGIVVNHNAGVTKMEFRHLPGDLREKFAYASDKADALKGDLAKKKLEGQREYELWDAKNKSKLAEKERIEGQTAAKRSIRILEEEIKQRQDKITSLEEKIEENNYNQTFGEIINASTARNSILRKEIEDQSRLIRAAEARIEKFRSFE